MVVPGKAIGGGSVAASTDNGEIYSFSCSNSKAYTLDISYSEFMYDGFVTEGQPYSLVHGTVSPRSCLFFSRL